MQIYFFLLGIKSFACFPAAFFEDFLALRLWYFPNTCQWRRQKQVYLGGLSIRGFLDLDAKSPKHIAGGTEWGDEQRPEQFCSQKAARHHSVCIWIRGKEPEMLKNTKWHLYMVLLISLKVAWGGKYQQSCTNIRKCLFMTDVKRWHENEKQEGKKR